MRFLIGLLILVSCGKSQTDNSSLTKELPADYLAAEVPATMAEEAGNTYQSIVGAQEKALDGMEKEERGFRMTEMITDISVSRTGVLGLSALKANGGVEVRWVRKTPVASPEKEAVDLVLGEDMDLEKATDAVTSLAVATGKIKKTEKLRARISQSLAQIETLVNDVGPAALGRWDFKGVRFDLNFSVGGEVLFFAKAGPNVRLRLEWNRKRSALKSTGKASRFVLNTLSVLNQVNNELALPGFSVRQLSLGVGMTYKGELGIWKHSSGFLGFLLFTPKPVKSLSVALTDDVFLLGGHEEKGEGFSALSGRRFVEGLRKSLQTASFFAGAAASRNGNWYVKEIKTVNDITYSGLFGLADLSTKGALEIDFKRNE